MEKKVPEEEKKEQKEQEKHHCLSCNETSETTVLLEAEGQGQKVWVCVRCLPVLIHGAH